MKQLLAALGGKRRRPRSGRAAGDGLELQLPDATAGELEIIRSVQPFTMTSPERLVGLIRAVEHIRRHGIAGAVVECGVWRGGSMMAVAKALQRDPPSDPAGATGEPRQLWLFDTFEGMTRPGSADVDLRNQPAMAQLRADRDPLSPDSPWCLSPLDEVRANLATTGYCPDSIHFVQGPVEETLTSHDTGPIALLRLDTDWYESTRCELEVLFPRLVPGGVLIVDDYGHWQGCRKAVDEYFARTGVPMLLQRMDYTGRMGVKP